MGPKNWVYGLNFNSIFPSVSERKGLDRKTDGQQSYIIRDLFFLKKYGTLKKRKREKKNHKVKYSQPSTPNFRTVTTRRPYCTCNDSLHEVHVEGRGGPVGRHQRLEQAGAGGERARAVAGLQRHVLGEARRRLLQREHLGQLHGPVVRVVDADAGVRRVSGMVLVMLYLKYSWTGRGNLVQSRSCMLKWNVTFCFIPAAS